MATRFFSRPSVSLDQKRPASWRPQSILPGFPATFGLTVFYLSVVVLLPVATLFLKLSSFSIGEIWQEMASPRAVASYKLTLGCSFIAAAINTVMGLVIAWVLTRGEFWGRRLMDAMIDIPFALPTAVAGLAITAVYAPTGWLGKHLAAWGFPAAYTPLGIVIAVMFVGLPFVVRTVQPVLLDLDVEIEEAALSLGATHWKTFQRVILPVVFPSLLTGFAMAFSRGLGEFGAVIFIAGNLPMKTEITPLVIVTKLDEYNMVGANALALVLLTAAFVLLWVINSLHAWSRRYQESRVQTS